MGDSAFPNGKTYDAVMRTRRLLPVALVAFAVLLTACSTSTTVVSRPAATSDATQSVTVPPLVLLDKQSSTVLGQPLTYPTALPAQVSSAIITLLPGQQTGPHRHEVPLYGYVLEGTLTVTYDGGVVKTYPAGTALMEAIGTTHNGQNLGTVTVRILVTFIGAQGVANTVKL